MSGVDLSDLPTDYDITIHSDPFVANATIDTGLDNIRIKEIPRIILDPITLNTDSNVTLNLGDINIRIKEIPSLRVHFPARFDFGISLFGLEVLSFSLCGESMIITEPYTPHKCEICEPVRLPEPDRPSESVP